MSHRSQVATNIVNLGFLKQSLQNLGISYYEGQELTGSYARGWSASEKMADLVLSLNGRKDVGFKINAQGSYDMVGDFYQLNQKEIQGKIEQQYSIVYTLDAIGSTTTHGIVGTEFTTLENGDIVMEAEVDEEQIVNS